MLPTSITDLISYFSKLSGIGEKTAQRYVFELLDWDEGSLEEFAQVIHNLKLNIKKCQNCGNITETDLCEICKDQTRDKRIICVVANVKELLAIEKTNSYNGIYYVLNGLISISNGVYPEDLAIENLVQKCVDDDIQEVILALNLNVEGETTALYISKRLEEYNITSSRLASGLPMGGNIEYADSLTLHKAFEGRKKYEIKGENE